MKKTLATACGVILILAYVAGLLLHLFTCYIAYHVGFPATIVTFCLPVFSEIYWFFVLWSENGFVNIYSIAFLLVAALYAVGFGGASLLGDKTDSEV